MAVSTFFVVLIFETKWLDFLIRIITQNKKKIPF